MFMNLFNRCLEAHLTIFFQFARFLTIKCGESSCRKNGYMSNKQKRKGYSSNQSVSAYAVKKRVRSVMVVPFFQYGAKQPSVLFTAMA